jgi:hypothetical protein
MAADLHHAARLGDRHLGLAGDLLDRRLAPRSWSSFLLMLRSLLIVSIMCTGMRIVRA